MQIFPEMETKTPMNLISITAHIIQIITTQIKNPIVVGTDHFHSS